MFRKMTIPTVSAEHALTMSVLNARSACFCARQVFDGSSTREVQGPMAIWFAQRIRQFSSDVGRGLPRWIFRRGIFLFVVHLFSVSTELSPTRLRWQWNVRRAALGCSFLIRRLRVNIVR